MPVTPPRKPGAPRPGGASGPGPLEPETGKDKLASERLADHLAALEEELEEIKVKYEMYFIGAERMEPARRRDDLKREVARMQSAFTRNAALRFRIQALHARFLSYERLWTRSAREKEAGTYRRDLLKARRRGAERKATGPGPETVAKGAPVPAAPETANPSRPAVAPAAAPAIGDGEMRALYESLVAAKRSCNEDVSKVTYESLVRTVARQAPEIAARFKASSVEFKVVVKDGRAVLTAVPRK